MPRYSVAALPAGVHLFRCADGHETHGDSGLADCPREVVIDPGDPPNRVPPTIGPHGIPVVEITDELRVAEVSDRLLVELRIDRATVDARKVAVEREPLPAEPTPPVVIAAALDEGGRRG